MSAPAHPSPSSPSATPVPMAGLAAFGQFDAARGCFTLTAPPPRKWVNVHVSDPGETEMYAEVTNLGDGPVRVRGPRGETVQLVGYDCKFFYVRDDATNEAFNPGGEPVATAVADVATHYHAGHTVTAGTALGLRATQRTFVHPDEPVLVTTLTVANRTDRPRHVSLFAYAMFQLAGSGPEGQWVGKDNHTTIHPELAGVLVHNRSRNLPLPRWHGFLAALQREAWAGGSGYRDFFTRSDFGLGTPRLLWGWNADNRPYRGPDSAACVQLRCEIPPGGEARADFLLGACADAADAGAILGRHSPASLDAALARVVAREDRRAAAFRVDTGHPDRDALVNVFVKKAMMSYIIDKSGVRDNLQNDLGVSLFEPAAARANILQVLAAQNADGSFPHSFRPFNRTPYSDKPAWCLQVVPWYIQETGDWSILEEALAWQGRGPAAPVHEHLARAMRFLAADTGAHGLCDQHHADWNDGLEPSEATGARESVMVTQQLCLGLRELGELARRRGDTALAAECAQRFAHFERLLNDVAWDGRWYLRTLCASGYRLGSAANPEGSIFMNTQSWAVLSGTAPADRARSAMEAVDELIENEYGFAICAPAFTAFDERVGRYSASRPYFAENGGCYNHAAGFKGVADCVLGRAEEAWRTWLKVTPGSPWNPVDNSCAEPFSFTNCYSRTPEWPGMSMYPWRTGTTSWLVQLLVEWILGARRHHDGLLLDPCLSREVPRARISRLFRGARYDIEIDNTAGRGRGLTSLTVDGRPVAGPLLPPAPAGSVVKVAAVL